MQKALLIIAILSFSVVGLWKIMYPSGTWRYKMTVEVETPEGIKAGSAVREVSVYTYPTPFPEDSGFKIGLAYGEAVVVDLGIRGVLFALTTENTWGTRYSKMLPFFVFSKEEGSLTPQNIRRFRTLQAGPVEIDPKWYPDLAFFKDINNFKTATRIPSDDLAAVFGDGVALKSITLAMTKEPVTKGVVDKYLPWLDAWREKQNKLPVYTTVNPKDWEDAENAEFARAAIGGLKREGF